MTTYNFQRLKISSLTAGIIVLLLCFVFITPARAGQPAQETDKYCLSCHSDSNLSMTMPSGEKVSLFVSLDSIEHSVHGKLGMECEACHTNLSTFPHPQQNFQSRRDLSISLYQACQKCHADNYEKTKDSYHAKIAAEGNKNAAICTDCHGYHDIQVPDQPRSRISTTCSKCHAEIYNTYKESVHGSALINENNQDVPVCTDCHGVHNILDPRTANFRVQTPEMCARCHADKTLMDKYGLSTDVYSLYKTSWHGVDISVYKARWPTIWHDSAVCSDCHGTHNIFKTDDPRSEVNPKNLLQTCRKCHPDAGPNWTGAWTGHNKISLQRTPMLFYVDAFYSSFTPFILWICIIYVVLQIIHAIVDRFRSNLP